MTNRAQLVLLGPLKQIDVPRRNLVRHGLPAKTEIDMLEVQRILKPSNLPRLPTITSNQLLIASQRFD